MSPGFTSPPDPIAFRHQVWDIVRQIPVGRVSTYGQIAALVPNSSGLAPQDYRAFGARWVGGAMATCPEGVPWQRVINSQGKISLKGPSAETQRRLLEEEGVQFDDRDRIDLARFGWAGLEKV
jgi:methylated-DNA-protein-cysteine methyltransferase related protein